MVMDSIICVFGDSTAWGAWDKEKGGWVNRLWLYCAEKANDENLTEIYNLSISGGTTETILARFENEARVRHADALIFQTGANDSAEDGGRGSPNVSPEKFRENIREIINHAKEIHGRIAFVGAENCDETRTMPVSWCNYHYTNVRLKEYNDIMKEVCAGEGVPFCDVFGLLKNEDLADGLHPNAAGHQKLFEKVRDFLTEQKWI